VDTNALILFADARGFTRWANNPEVFARLDRFAAAFNSVLRKSFPKRGYFLKGLGDGAMIVRRLDADLNAESAAALLRDTLELVTRTQGEFTRTCETFAHAIGHRADLTLGWGIVRGPVQRLTSPEDYVGPNVNKCARLCHEARPYGVVIDMDDFPIYPGSPDFEFYPQVRKLTGIEEGVRVWVTKEIASGFLTREKLRQTPEVHVAGQCIDASSRKGLKVLIARRSSSRRLYPGLLEGCGGQLAASETFTEGVARHFRLEMNIDVKVLEHLHCFYAIREPEEEVIPGIRFLCERVGDEQPRSDNHSETVWVTESAFRSLPGDQFIPGLKEQVLELIERYKQQGPRR
jgi:class 3 adenylate cyclase